MTSASRPTGPHTAAPSTPRVSVVVICFNDSTRLPLAVRSVLQQTLADLEVLIVDDCSTDSTPRVASELVAEDSRVRSIRLPENSGGCGAPRNMGVSAAKGDYLMFLDSDDVLTSGACEALVSAAESSSSDVVSGALRRVHQVSGVVESWYQNLYDTERVYNGLDEAPELVYDTVSTNKLYRASFMREAGLRFPVDMHYEDVVFTAEMFSRASRIHYITQQVYEWRVYDDETRKTITNQRSQPANYSDRTRAVSVVREIYRQQSLGVRVSADVKALRHHLTLHLRDAPELIDPELFAMLRVFSPFVEDTLPEAIRELTVFERARFAAVLLTDVQFVRRSLRDESLGLLSGVPTSDGELIRWRYPEVVVPPNSPADMFLRFPEPENDSDIPLPLRKAAVINVATMRSGGLDLGGAIETRDENLESTGMLTVYEGSKATGQSLCSVSINSDGQTTWQARLRGASATGLRHRVPLTFTLDIGQFRLPVFSAIDSLPILQDRSVLGRLLGDGWQGRRSEDGTLELHASPGRFGRLLRRVVKKLF